MIASFRLVRAAVLIAISYFGWIGVCIIATPWVVFHYLRREHQASRISAAFLAFWSIWPIGWLIEKLISGPLY